MLNINNPCVFDLSIFFLPNVIQIVQREQFLSKDKLFLEIMLLKIEMRSHK